MAPHTMRLALTATQALWNETRRVALQNYTPYVPHRRIARPACLDPPRTDTCYNGVLPISMYRFVRESKHASAHQVTNVNEAGTNTTNDEEPCKPSLRRTTIEPNRLEQNLEPSDT